MTQTSNKKVPPEIRFIDREIDDFLTGNIEYLKSKYMGEKVKILNGRYKNRVGFIDGIIVDQKIKNFGLAFLVHPYKLDNKGNMISDDYLYMDVDARTYWSIKDLEFINI